MIYKAHKDTTPCQYQMKSRIYVFFMIHFISSIPFFMTLNDVLLFSSVQLLKIKVIMKHEFIFFSAVKANFVIM